MSCSFMSAIADDIRAVDIHAENEILRNEVIYLKSLLFSDRSAQSCSIIESLRSAVRIKEENAILRRRDDNHDILHRLCEELEAENKILRQALDQAGRFKS
jgi:hypothetical protein